MRSLSFVAILAVLAAAGSVRAQTDAFSHDPARVPVGTTRTYVKSNLDGSRAIRVIARLVSDDRLEVLKLEPENGAAAWVVARMDWTTASADSLTSAVLFPDGTRRDQATLTLDPDTRRVTVQVFGVADTLTVGTLPVHMYNFDFLSLAAALPHLLDPDAPFTVGIMNPTFRPEPPVLSYDGEVRFEPVGRDARRGVAARRYRVSGAGMRDEEAWIWCAVDDGRLLAVESPVPDNPDWTSFRLELESTTVMDDDAWSAFVAREVEAL
jgi:hypothetical protein